MNALKVAHDGIAFAIRKGMRMTTGGQPLASTFSLLALNGLWRGELSEERVHCVGVGGVRVLLLLLLLRLGWCLLKHCLSACVVWVSCGCRGYWGQ